jgi:hypothetical protein
MLRNQVFTNCLKNPSMIMTNFIAVSGVLPPLRGFMKCWMSSWRKKRNGRKKKRHDRQKKRNGRNKINTSLL